MINIWNIYERSMQDKAPVYSPSPLALDLEWYLYETNNTAKLTVTFNAKYNFAMYSLNCDAFRALDIGYMLVKQSSDAAKITYCVYV